METTNVGPHRPVSLHSHPAKISLKIIDFQNYNLNVFVFVLFIVPINVVEIFVVKILI